jgi:DNA-directed RNA polymerase subunit RPC12/RpoP
MVNDPNLGIFPGMEVEGHDKAAEWGPCGCWTCVSEFQVKKDGHSMFMPFIVCPNCGNKRCPKAQHHDNECSGSNDPGQPGSRFE